MTLTYSARNRRAVLPSGMIPDMQLYEELATAGAERFGSVRQFAIAAGISDAALSRLRAGKRQTGSVDVLAKLLAAVPDYKIVSRGGELRLERDRVGRRLKTEPAAS